MHFRRSLKAKFISPWIGTKSYPISRSIAADKPGLTDLVNHNIDEFRYDLDHKLLQSES